MPKTRDQKEQTINDLVEKLKKFKSVIFADYKGLKVSEASEIRKLCRKENVEYLVIKKTLIKLALEKAGIKDVDVKAMQGNIALIVGFEDEVAPAKIVATYAKKHEALKMLGGIMENKFIDLSQVQILANIPSRSELLAKLLASFQSPASGFVNVLVGNVRGLLNVLNGIKDSKA